MNHNCGYKTQNKGRVSGLTCYYVAKNQVWSLKYSTAYPLNKDPSTLKIKERQVRAYTHSYELNSLAML